MNSPALFLISRRNVLSFTIKYDVSCRFYVAAVYQVKEASL